jgi:hypothetical protein
MTTTQLIIALTSLPVTYCIGIWFKNVALFVLRKALKHKNIIISNDAEYIRAMEKENEVLKKRLVDSYFAFGKLQDAHRNSRIKRRNNFWRKNRKNAVR